ncbi:MAG: hypothetical protein KIT84_09400 [Labilithrix sp.]|nr:hypothetical protein [Labilithrix sp.]MCW5811216.1 hypothetical protein [Labilithrix sp.]
MKRFMLSVVGAASIVALGMACSSDPSGSGANNDGASSGVVPPGGKLPDGGFNDPPFTAPECVVAEGEIAEEAKTLADESGQATATAEGAGCKRTFTVDSTAPRKDNVPEGARTFAEEGRPSLQTTSPLFDALYQLALEEAQECSVSAIKDYAFNDGAETACGEGGCFETGRKWNYVWTRDTAYAVDLGLAWVDPIRARNSLAFKLSKRRDGTDMQIVQDTGTGGSYPVSTDRSVWSIGAREVLQHLTGDARTKFRDDALEAAKNTIAHDRATVFDESDGLYRGEQSFLDWREQTYPGWANPDLVHIGMSKALGTNVGHLSLLDLAAELAEETGDAEAATTMQDRAKALRAAIRTRFWLPEDKQLSTYITTQLDPSPVRRFDLLGTSLAVLFDATSPDEAKQAIASYPTLSKGPPVVFPQQKETPIYHNRAIWPFVTAYWVKAAKKVGNERAFEEGIKSLVRGAALNLSNMENLEVVTGTHWVEDGAYSGPVVNSQRQVWSVAGYIGMVNGSLFGVSLEKGGVRVQPFLTRGLRAMFPNAKKIALNDVVVRGKKLSVVLNLPDDAQVSAGGAYVIEDIRFNSVPPEEGGFIADSRLKERNLVEVDFALPTAPPAALKVIGDVSDYRSIYAPRTPSIASLTLDGGKVVVNADFANEVPAEITWSVYRDGARVATGLGAFTKTWKDQDTNGDATPSHCYTIETRFGSSGNLSQHAKPACFWSSNPQNRITSKYVGTRDVTVTGGTVVDGHTTDWGDAEDELAATFTATRSGAHLVQAVYANGAGPISTGITCAVKRVTVEEQPGGGVVGSGYMMMPQRGDWASWGESSFVRANLTTGKTYKVRFSHDAKSTNMSAFEHFAVYTGGTGGKAGVFFKVDLREIKLLSLVP